MKGVEFISNRDETIPIFKNPILEKLSHTHPALPAILYLPVVGYFLYTAFAKGTLGVDLIIVLFIAGLLVWTLIEYIFHRFLFHYESKSSIGRYLHFLVHGVHHDYPQDSKRLVMPPAVSIPLAIIFYFTFVIILGEIYTSPLYAGMIFGYVCYDMIHFATHHFPMRNRMGKWLKKHHLRHHYQDETRDFGVSPPLWDWVFRTSHQRNADFQSANQAGKMPALQKEKLYKKADRS